MKNNLMQRGPVSNLSSGNLHSKPIASAQLDHEVVTFMNYWQKMNSAVTVPHIFGKLNELSYISNLAAVVDPSLKRKGMWFSDSDVFKSLEAAIWASQHDSSLLRKIKYDEVIEIIARAQDADGYINSWFQIEAQDQRWKDLASGHEMYTAGHLIQAGVAESRIIGKGTLFDVSIKFADLLVKKFGGNTPYAADGHPELETALIELYRETDVKDYLDLAEKMLEGRGTGFISSQNTGRFHPSPPVYIQDHMSIRESEQVVGHCVRQMYLNIGVLDLYMETEDKALLDVQEKMWEDSTYTKMYLTGGIGSRHRDESFGDPFELPNDRAYAETCASIAYFMWNWRLLLATGKKRYADLMEQLAYNLIAGSTSQDFKRFFYSNPLHRRADHLAAFDEESSERMDWYRVSCCPPNIGRLVASIEHYAVSENPEEVLIHQFLHGEFGSDTNQPWSISLSTNYPQSGALKIVINEMGDQRLKVRIPEWCHKFEAKLNEKKIDSPLQEGGYLVFPKSSTGDSFEINFTMDFEYIHPHQLLDASRGMVAVRRGPEIYALDQSWNSSELVVEHLQIKTDGKFKSEIAKDLNGLEFTKVKVNGSSLVVDRSGPSYTSESKSPREKEIELVLVPYSRWGNPVTGGMRVWIP
ncbi:MAG: glycoside hydrolase family 127 protein, partial [Actinobacteria bacterium]|nr:glycoside hydrolase family 127 protein [Actinomycetota bacterium]